jgi:hypothetical protein
VLDNYTIQFLIQKYSPGTVYGILTNPIYNTPYPVWKWAIDALKTMNVTQAAFFGQNNITKFVAPYYGLGPYYMTSMTTSLVMTINVEPQNLLKAWYEAYPFGTWNYYPEIENWFTETPVLTLIKGYKANWIWASSSSAMAASINSTSGWSMYYLPTFWIYGILVNPYYYPWNIPAVRRAVFCYAVNRTAALDSYNPIGITDDYLAPVSSIMIDTFPESIKSILFKCPYDPAKAAQILRVWAST